MLQRRQWSETEIERLYVVYSFLLYSFMLVFGTLAVVMKVAVRDCQ